MRFIRPKEAFFNLSSIATPFLYRFNRGIRAQVRYNTGILVLMAFQAPRLWRISVNFLEDA